MAAIFFVLSEFLTVFGLWFLLNFCIAFGLHISLTLLLTESSSATNQQNEQIEEVIVYSTAEYRKCCKKYIQRNVLVWTCINLWIPIMFHMILQCFIVVILKWFLFSCGDLCWLDALQQCCKHDGKCQKSSYQELTPSPVISWNDLPPILKQTSYSLKMWLIWELKLFSLCISLLESWLILQYSIRLNVWFIFGVSRCIQKEEASKSNLKKIQLSSVLFLLLWL